MSDSEIQRATNVRRRRNFYNICHSRTQIINEILKKIEYKSDERPSEVKFFNSICHNRTQLSNGILNEIEIQGAMKARRRRNYFATFITVCTPTIMNGIVNEIEIQEREKPATAGDIF